MEHLKAQTAIFISFFIYLFISSFSLHASVVLNEVAIQPNQIVELYNTATMSADISGWYIDDAGGTTYFTVPQQTVLAPLSCTIFTADFNLNKASSDVVRLFDNVYPPSSSSAKLIESYSYSKAPDSGYSFIKRTDGGSEWQTSLSSLGLFNESLTSCISTPTPTPFPTETPTTIPSPTSPAEVVHEGGSPTPTASPMDYSNIFISEVFPYPQTNDHEWVELYNNNDFSVCLQKWYIDDGESTGSTPKHISLCLDVYSYGTAEITSSLLNNSGDTTRLLNAEKNEKDSMEYGKTTQGKSIGRVSLENDEYCEQEPSKNAPNGGCITQDTPSVKNTKSITANPPPTKIPSAQVKKQVLATPQKLLINNSLVGQTTTQIKGEVLGAAISYPLTPIPYLSSVSFSYSLLTILSIFIKMKNA